MNKKSFFTYPAIFTKEGSGYWVQFLDLKGCFSEGSSFENAILKSKEALGLYLEELEDYPEPTIDVKKIKLKDNQIISFVSVDMNEHKQKYSNKTVKKTLSIPAWLNAKAENANINFSKVLKEALIVKLDIKNK